jgi:hypothetical protein
MTNETILPVINMNGNSARALAEQYMDMYNKVDDIIHALSQVEFHPRDYYPVSGLWPKALDQRKEKFKHLIQLRDEMRDIALHCQSQIRK